MLLVLLQRELQTVKHPLPTPLLLALQLLALRVKGCDQARPLQVAVKVPRSLLLSEAPRCTRHACASAVAGEWWKGRVDMMRSTRYSIAMCVAGALERKQPRPRVCKAACLQSCVLVMIEVLFCF